jgi:hypothetical protein
VRAGALHVAALHVVLDVMQVLVNPTHNSTCRNKKSVWRRKCMYHYHSPHHTSPRDRHTSPRDRDKTLCKHGNLRASLTPATPAACAASKKRAI